MPLSLPVPARCRYALMCQCWSSDKYERPTFAKLQQELSTLQKAYRPRESEENLYI